MKWLLVISPLIIGTLYFLTPSTIPWTEEMVLGAHFESLSDTGILSISFSSTGNIATGVYGDQNAVTGVVYNWHIDGSGRLALTEEGGDDSYLFKLISYTEESVEVWEFLEGKTQFRRSLN